MEVIRYERSVLGQEGESIHLKFCIDGRPIGLSCKVLQAHEYPSNTTAGFSHPSPCFTRLFCFKSGVARFKSAAESLSFVPGMVYLIPSDMPFDIVYEKTHLYFFHLHVTDFTELSVFGRTKEVLTLEDNYLFEQILSTYESGNTQELLSVISLAVSRLMVPVRNELLASHELSSYVREVLDLISCIPPAAANVNELADELRVSRSTLSRNFRNSFGYSLKKYINNITMQRAREQLRYTGDTVEDIAAKLGFNEATYFYRFFRQHAGMTPLEYRGAIIRD